MLNFCIFVFAGYFLKTVFRMIIPKKVIIHKGVMIAQYADVNEMTGKRKTPGKKPTVLYADGKYNNENKKCA